MRVFSVISFAILLFSTASIGWARSLEADKKIKAAVDSYAELDFEKALGLIKEAQEQIGNSRDQLKRIFSIMGLCQSTLGKYDQARKAFLKLLTLEPSFRLGTDVSPRVKKPFEQVLKQNPARLEVRSVVPSGIQKGKPIKMSFEVISDPAKMLRSVKVWYKVGGQKKYSSIRAKYDRSKSKKTKRRISVNIPLPFVKKKKATLFWYAVAEGYKYSTLQWFGEAKHPGIISISDSPQAKIAAANPWYKRWWVWTIVGGVVVAGATTAAVLGTRSADNGPFDFDVSFSTAQ